MLVQFTPKASAQENEVGLWVGAANYFGDLNPVFSFKEMRWASGMFYRYNINTRMSLKAGVNYARVAASDNKINRVPYPKIRNLSFESDIIEVAGTYELNFFKFDPAKKKIFTPYVFVGISMFYYNPFTRLNGNRVFLQPVGTEGQNTPFGEENSYQRYSFAIPFGGGIKYAINKKWGINFEISSRRTFTDYIDDVSGSYVPEEILGEANAGIADPSVVGLPANKQRGTAKDVDRFNFIGVAVTYTINTTKCPPLSNSSKGY